MQIYTTAFFDVEISFSSGPCCGLTNNKIILCESGLQLLRSYPELRVASQSYNTSCSQSDLCWSASLGEHSAANSLHQIVDFIVYKQKRVGFSNLHNDALTLKSQITRRWKKHTMKNSVQEQGPHFKNQTWTKYNCTVTFILLLLVIKSNPLMFFCKSFSYACFILHSAVRCNTDEGE